MGKHKKQKKKKKVSQAEFERRLRIWSLVVPIITSLFTSVTAISVAYISSRANQEKFVTPKMYSSETGQKKLMIREGESPSEEYSMPASPTEVPAPSMQRSFSYWPIILFVLLFLFVFFTVKFIGRSFVRHHYEPQAGTQE